MLTMKDSNLCLTNNRTSYTVMFEKVSHVKFKRMTENTWIKRIKKGETYEVSDLWGTFPKEDKCRRKWFSDKYRCIASEDCWRSDSNNVFRNVSDVVSDWNNSVMYNEDEDKWYNRPWLEVHMLNGQGSYKMYYDSDEELHVVLSSKYDREQMKEINVSD